MQSFLFPRLSRRFFLRVALVAVAAWLLFGHILLPTRINGISMEPTYRDGGFTFCLAVRYIFSGPRRGDVVAVRLAGKRIMYLKRVIGIAGDTISFQDGKLFVNGVERPEPYVRYQGNWTLAPRLVKQGHVYVVGDNRGTSMETHVFGQTPLQRIVGGPIW